jgi:hypothetical protein
MPKTPKFLKMEKSMIKYYGKKKGTQVAYATAHKKKMKIDVKGGG